MSKTIKIALTNDEIKQYLLNALVNVIGKQICTGDGSYDTLSMEHLKQGVAVCLGGDVYKVKLSVEKQ